MASDNGESSETSERWLPAAWESAITEGGAVFYADPAPTGPRLSSNFAAATSPTAAGGGGDHGGHLPPPAAATPGTGKLRNLLQRRRSQKSSRGQNVSAALQRGRQSEDSNHEVYEVCVRLEAGGSDSDPPAESLLGLISRQHRSAPVVVTALSPSGPLISSGRVRVGDLLESVNGTPVTTASLSPFLLSLPRRAKVRLTFRREVATSPTTSLTNGMSKPVMAEGAVTSLDEEESQLKDLAQLLRDVPFGLLCLSAADLTETSPDRQDIVYQFPGYDTALVQARGALLTLAGITPQVSGDAPKRAVLTTGKCPVNVTLTSEDDLVVLLAAPNHSASAMELGLLGSEIWHLLRLEFGSLRSAFREARNCTYVDHLISLVVQRLLLTPHVTSQCPGALPQGVPGQLESLVPAGHAMHLPRHVQVLIDDSLTELESGDFGEESEEYYGLQRMYLIAGCALYYKGYLAASHLSPTDQTSVQLYLKHHQLLERSRRHGWRQLVVWRRLHTPPTPPPPPPPPSTPPSTPTPTPAPTHGETEAYSRPDSVQHLMLVGTGHAILAVLLQSTSFTVKVEELTGPDTIYVEEAQATLFQLESMGILDMCESWLGGCSVQGSCSDPHLPGAARLLDSSVNDGLSEKRWWSRLVAGRQNSGRRTSSSAGGGSTIERDHVGLGEPGGSLGGSGADAGDGGAAPHDRLSHSGDESGSTDGSAATDTWQIYKGPPKNRLLPNQYELAENKKVYIGQALEDSARVVPDTLSVAVQHICIRGAVAVLAVPEHMAATAVRVELLKTFSDTVARLLPLMSQAGDDGVSPTRESPPREVGAFFSLDGPDQQRTFWVVGRQMSAAASDRSVFVCVPGDSPPQMLQIAFQLSHGTGPW